MATQSSAFSATAVTPSIAASTLAAAPFTSALTSAALTATPFAAALAPTAVERTPQPRTAPAPPRLQTSVTFPNQRHALVRSEPHP